MPCTSTTTAAINAAINTTQHTARALVTLFIGSIRGHHADHYWPGPFHAPQSSQLVTLPTSSQAPADQQLPTRCRRGRGQESTPTHASIFLLFSCDFVLLYDTGCQKTTKTRIKLAVAATRGFARRDSGRVAGKPSLAALGRERVRKAETADEQNRVG